MGVLQFFVGLSAFSWGGGAQVLCQVKRRYCQIVPNVLASSTSLTSCAFAPVRQRLLVFAYLIGIHRSSVQQCCNQSCGQPAILQPYNPGGYDVQGLPFSTQPPNIFCGPSAMTMKSAPRDSSNHPVSKPIWPQQRPICGLSHAYLPTDAQYPNKCRLAILELLPILQFSTWMRLALLED